MSAPYLSHSDPRPVLKLEESYFSFSRCGANATFFSLSATSQSSFFTLSSLAMSVSQLIVKTRVDVDFQSCKLCEG